MSHGLVPVRLLDSATGALRSSIYDIGGRLADAFGDRDLLPLRMGADGALHIVGAAKKSGAVEVIDTVAHGVGKFIGTIRDASNPPSNRAKWKRKQYEKQIARDRKAKNALAKKLRAQSAELAAIKEERAKAADPKGGDGEEGDDGDEGDEVGRWNKQRPVGGGGGRWNETRVTDSIVISTKPGQRIGVVPLGNGLHILAEVPETALRDCSPAEIGAAIETAAIGALSMPVAFSGAPGPWTRLLPAKGLLS